MHAIEFRAKIKNGFIEVPKRYKKLVTKFARIIILQEEEPIPNSPQDPRAIQQILDQIAERKVFSRIVDPVKWQRDLRSEWDERIG